MSPSPSRPGRWRWYHHVFLVVAMFGFAALWTYLRPSDRVANVALVACAVAFVIVFVAIQIKKVKGR